MFLLLNVIMNYVLYECIGYNLVENIKELFSTNFFFILKAREEAYQEELERTRIEREKEIARLRAQQERAKDKQAERVGNYQNYARCSFNHVYTHDIPLVNRTCIHCINLIRMP